MLISPKLTLNRDPVGVAYNLVLVTVVCITCACYATSGVMPEPQNWTCFIDKRKTVCVEGEVQEIWELQSLSSYGSYLCRVYTSAT